MVKRSFPDSDRASSCSAKKGEDSFINMIAVGEKKKTRNQNQNLKLHLRSFKNLRLYVYTMGRSYGAFILIGKFNILKS